MSNFQPLSQAVHKLQEDKEYTLRLKDRRGKPYNVKALFKYKRIGENGAMNRLGNIATFDFWDEDYGTWRNNPIPYRLTDNVLVSVSNSGGRYRKTRKSKKSNRKTMRRRR